MDIIIRKPSLATFIGGGLAFILFAGRWGISAESQDQSLPVLGEVLYEFTLQPRWWMLAMMLVAVTMDFHRRRVHTFAIRARHRGLVIFLALAFTLLTGAAFSDGSETTISKALDIVGLAVTALIIFYCQNQPSATREQLQTSVLTNCFILGTAISLMALATLDLSERAAVADSGPNTFVRIVGIAAISCIGLNRIPRALAFCATAGYLAMIVLTQSRGGLLAFACAVGLQFVWIFGWRSKLIYGGIALAAVSLFATFTAIGQRCVEIVQHRVFTQTISQSYTAGRDEIYTDAWLIWKENLFFGNGLNAWRHDLATYPHNIILEIGCDSGLLGVAIFSILMWIYAANALRCRTTASKSIACITLFYFLAAQFSGDIYDSRGLFFFGTILSSAPIAASRRNGGSPSAVRTQTSMHAHLGTASKSP